MIASHYTDGDNSCPVQFPIKFSIAFSLPDSSPCELVGPLQIRGIPELFDPFTRNQIRLE